MSVDRPHNALPPLARSAGVWARSVYWEYRRMRALCEGASFGRVEAVARAVALVEQRRRFGEDL